MITIINEMYKFDAQKDNIFCLHKESAHIWVYINTTYYLVITNIFIATGNNYD